VLSQVKQSAYDCFWRPVYSSARFFVETTWLRSVERFQQFHLTVSHNTGSHSQVTDGWQTDRQTDSILATIYIVHYMQSIGRLITVGPTQCTYDGACHSRLCRAFWSHLRQTYCQHSLYRQTLLLVGSHAAPPPSGTVFLHLYSLLTVLLVLGLRSTCSQDICSRSTYTVRASYTLMSVFRAL